MRKDEIDDILGSFSKYWYEHPDQRFWQALVNWQKLPYLFIMPEPPENFPSAEDTHFIEDSDLKI